MCHQNIRSPVQYGDMYISFSERTLMQEEGFLVEANL